ncbi:MAG: glycosyltransferase family 2 protein [Bacteroidales bacterium]|jgi:glycosyltransferase involved in cell wall biosynthesis|nr:glycosyltransferase family 2 protein [Bacteroidales bacterium]
MQKLSVAIITFNEEHNIARCLNSVQEIADEIVVVDSFSTDTTEDICSRYSQVRFIKHPFAGHIEQKNYAKSICSHDLVLSLDADEALSSKLRTSIVAIKTQNEYDGYTCNRLNHYCGQAIKHCGWYPDISLRLWHKDKGNWGGSNPHDIFIMNSHTRTKHLHGDILHYTFESIEEHCTQINYFSTISAESKLKKGKQANWLQILTYPFWRFLRTYIVQLGFLDGAMGFIICKNSAHAVFLKYIKLYKLRRDVQKKK